MEIETIKAMIAEQLPRTYEALLLTFYGNEAYLDQNLLVFGDDYGTKICLSLIDGCVYSVDPDNKLPTRFVNSSIESLSKFLHQYSEYLKEIDETDKEEDQIQLLSKWQERCLAIDDAALSADDTWWRVVLEQSKNGLL